MTDTIPPALSAEDWTERTRDDLGDVPNDGSRGDGVAYIADGKLCVRYEQYAMQSIDPSEIPALIALANHHLPDSSPYKITRGDVDELRKLANTGSDLGFAGVEQIETLAAKLSALLRPE